MTANPDGIRWGMRRALCHIGRQRATLYRPDRDDYGGLLETMRPIGRLMGYRYTKRNGLSGLTIGLPGQLDDTETEGDYYMVLYATQEDRWPGLREYDPPDAQRDDVLVTDGRRYRIVSARNQMGAYWTYRIKEM